MYKIGLVGIIMRICYSNHVGHFCMMSGWVGGWEIYIGDAEKERERGREKEREREVVWGRERERRGKGRENDQGVKVQRQKKRVLWYER